MYFLNNQIHLSEAEDTSVDGSYLSLSSQVFLVHLSIDYSGGGGRSPFWRGSIHNADSEFIDYIMTHVMERTHMEATV